MGVDVARGIHAMRLSSTNVIIVEVRVLEWVFIAAVSLLLKMATDKHFLMEPASSLSPADD